MLEAILAASWAATVAAKAEDLREPEKFTFPAEAQVTTLPEGSVMTMIVLLNVAFTCTIPTGTFCAVFNTLKGVRYIFFCFWIFKNI